MKQPVRGPLFEMQVFELSRKLNNACTSPPSMNKRVERGRLSKFKSESFFWFLLLRLRMDALKLTAELRPICSSHSSGSSPTQSFSLSSSSSSSFSSCSSSFASLLLFWSFETFLTGYFLRLVDSLSSFIKAFMSDLSPSSSEVLLSFGLTCVCMRGIV